jgi:hypothetical protein
MWKSIPTVGYCYGNEYVETLFELVLDVFLNDRGFADGLIAQQNHFVLGPTASHCT